MSKKKAKKLMMKEYEASAADKVADKKGLKKINESRGKSPSKSKG